MISPHPEFGMGMRNHKKSWDRNGTWVTRPIALPSYINTITSMRVWGEDVVGDSKVREREEHVVPHEGYFWI